MLKWGGVLEEVFYLSRANLSAVKFVLCILAMNTHTHACTQSSGKLCYSAWGVFQG